MIILTPLPRTEIFKYIPSGERGAELGVWNGQFAATILAKNKPRELHLVDPWGGSDDLYVQTYRIKHDMEAKFASVKQMFASETEAGIVKIHREYSTDFFKKLDDSFLDWVYIDGMHTYEAVLQDLNVVDQKVKDDGFILGHDFLNSEKKANFGVVGAVLKFLETRPYKLLLVTLENAPTYVIAKAPESDRAKSLINEVLNADTRAIQITPEILTSMIHIPYAQKDGKAAYLFCLGTK